MPIHGVSHCFSFYWGTRWGHRDASVSIVNRLGWVIDLKWLWKWDLHNVPFALLEVDRWTDVPFPNGAWEGTVKNLNFRLNYKRIEFQTREWLSWQIGCWAGQDCYVTCLCSSHLHGSKGIKICNISQSSHHLASYVHQATVVDPTINHELVLNHILFHLKLLCLPAFFIDHGKEDDCQVLYEQFPCSNVQFRADKDPAAGCRKDYSSAFHPWLESIIQ